MMVKEKEFVEKLLPKHYDCIAGNYGVRCVSEIGMQEGDEQFNLMYKAVKFKFKKRFLEVYHNTHTNHIDFTIYLKN